MVVKTDDLPYLLKTFFFVVILINFLTEKPAFNGAYWIDSSWEKTFFLKFRNKN